MSTDKGIQHLLDELAPQCEATIVKDASRDRCTRPARVAVKIRHLEHIQTVKGPDVPVRVDTTDSLFLLCEECTTDLTVQAIGGIVHKVPCPVCREVPSALESIVPSLQLISDIDTARA